LPSFFSESDSRAVCCSAQAELTGLLLYLVWFGHVVLLLPPAPDGTNLLFGVRRILLPLFFLQRLKLSVVVLLLGFRSGSGF